jgi:hypothetical protein
MAAHARAMDGGMGDLPSRYRSRVVLAIPREEAAFDLLLSQRRSIHEAREAGVMPPAHS